MDKRIPRAAVAFFYFVKQDLFFFFGEEWKFSGVYSTDFNFVLCQCLSLTSFVFLVCHKLNEIFLTRIRFIKRKSAGF